MHVHRYDPDDDDDDASCILGGGGNRLGAKAQRIANFSGVRIRVMVPSSGWNFPLIVADPFRDGFITMFQLHSINVDWYGSMALNDDPVG
jgi:hypothetical protein